MARTATAPTVVELPVEQVFGNPDQPRRAFDQAELEGLAQSIRQNGLLQPIKVTPRDGRWMIILGERRFRAHLLNGAKTVRAIIQDDMGELEILIEAIVENGQRCDVHPMEEAVAYQRCLEAGMSIDALATKLGLRQVWRVTERTCLLQLRPEYQRLARSGQLRKSQAFEMAQLSPTGQDHLFRAIRRGECPTYEALRSAALVLRDREQQTSLLDPTDEPTANERSLAKGLERRFAQVAAVLRASTVDNEVIAVKKIDPTRAGTLADLIKAIQGDLARIETALRAVPGRSHEHVAESPRPMRWQSCKLRRD